LAAIQKIKPVDGGKPKLPIREELAFQKALLRLRGLPYVFGGRGYGGIDCSSLIVRAVRQALRIRVSHLPWMTADQLGKGHHNLTKDIEDLDTREECVLAFFDWDEDAIYEHAAVRLLDWTWIWASSTAGMVVRVDPTSETVFRRQWREIEGALDRKNVALRTIDWAAAKGNKRTSATSIEDHVVEV